MYPILFHIGDRPVYTYGVTMGLIVILVYVLLSRAIAKRQPLSQLNARGIAVMLLVAMWFFQELPRLLLRAREQHSALAERVDGLLVLVPLSGLLSVLVLLLLILHCRVKGLAVLPVLDFLVPYFTLAYALQRAFGCFLAGCCFGTPTSLPWGVRFPESPTGPVPGVPVHPTQLYLSATALITWIALRRLDGRTTTAGTATAVATTGIFGSYFVISFYRGDLDTTQILLGLSGSQVFSLLLMLGGLGFGGLMASRRLRMRDEPQTA